jgi:inhibitor of cysteine peptidase
MPKVLFYLSFASLLLIFIPIITSSLSIADGTIAIGESENGKTISLVKGHILQLSLSANPSTGYSWQYIRQPDAGVLAQTSHYFQSLGNLPGAPSMEFWIFNTAGPGSTVISLKYGRKWLPADPPLKTYLVNIVVKK